MADLTRARSRAEMPLIDRVTAGALDEEYAEVAARRHPAPPGSRPPGRPGLVAAIAAAIFAVLVTVSFRQTQASAGVVDAGRAELEDRIRARREVVAASQEQVVRLRAQNAAAQTALSDLDDAQDQAAARVERRSAAAGFTPVSGEGLRIVVDDNPDGAPTDRVYDEDLALLVNGLWRAGAEAIAVNGNRLTVRSSFRFSGLAIRLNDVNVSLTPPYTVLALGDPRTLAPDLLDTTSGLRFQARVSGFGLRLEMDNEEQVALPAAPERLLGDLRSAEVLSTDEAARGEDAR